MNVQHRQFCDLYLKSGNGTDAYMTVYKVSRSVASTSAARLLGNVRVRRYLTRARLRMELNTEVTRERIVTALAQMAFVDMRKLGKWNRRKGFVIKNSDDLDDASAYAVESIKSVTTVERGKRKTETEIKVSSKQHALEKLAKMHGFDIPTDGLSDEEKIERLRALKRQMDDITSTRSKKK